MRPLFLLLRAMLDESDGVMMQAAKSERFTFN